MTINRENYESVFLDYYDGNLDQKSARDLMEFLSTNPDLRQEFEKQLLKMPATVQEVFQLSRGEGLSVKEIAVKMNLSEQTVKNYISMALQSLRAYLKQGDLSFFLALASFYLFNDFKP